MTIEIWYRRLIHQSECEKFFYSLTPKAPYDPSPLTPKSYLPPNAAIIFKILNYYVS